MDWTNVKPAETPKTYKQGPRVTASIPASGNKVRINFNKLAVDEFFGGEILDRPLTVQRRFDENGAAWLRISPDEDGHVNATNSIKGSAALIVERFAACVPSSKIVAAPCDMVEVDENDGALTLRLPTAFWNGEAS